MYRRRQVFMKLLVNDLPIAQYARGGRRLLDFLREDLHLTGTKEGCGEGECGACTVLLDGVSTLSCLIPMEKAIGRSVVTIEGIGSTEQLHPIQDALIQTGGVQCGMCTPGMVLSIVDLLARNARPNRDEISVGLAGNLCRCTGYQKIIEAVEHAVTEQLDAPLKVEDET